MHSRCSNARCSIIVLVTYAFLTVACSGGGSSSSPQNGGGTSAFTIDSISSTSLATNIQQYSFIDQNNGFVVPPGSNFPGTFRVFLLTDGLSNPRSLTFVTRNTGGQRTCTSSITLPDGRVIILSQQQRDTVYWPNSAAPEFLVLASCGISQDGGTVILLPTSNANIQSLSTAVCESQGYFSSILHYTSQGGAGECIARFPSSASAANQANKTTNGYYLFTIANYDSSQTTVVPYVIADYIPHSYPESYSIVPAQDALNVSIYFCGVPNLGVVTSHFGAQHTNAYWITNAARIRMKEEIYNGLGALINEVNWPSDSSYTACQPNDALKYGNLDLATGFQPLNETYQPANPSTIIIWVVNSITTLFTVAGDKFAGYSALPGTPYYPGTGFSALVVASPFDSSGNVTDAGLDQFGYIMAHELGHFLGLKHTTEFVGSSDGIANADYLPETPFCAPSIITNSMDSCPDRGNFMFPQAPNLGFGAVTHIAQLAPVASNPLVH